jgi:hypothetical protein
MLFASPCTIRCCRGPDDLQKMLYLVYNAREAEQQMWGALQVHGMDNTDAYVRNPLTIVAETYVAVH